MFRVLAAVLVVAAPLLASIGPAQALTAHQYMAQGRGHYVSSKKRVGGMGYRHYRYRHHVGHMRHR